MTTPREEQPPPEAPAAPRVSTAPPRSRWRFGSVPSRLGRARTSTVVLAVLFVAVFVLYVYVRPPTAATTPTGTTGGVPTTDGVPATSAPATSEPPTTTAATTTPSPTETTTESSTSEETTTSGTTTTTGSSTTTRSSTSITVPSPTVSAPTS